LPLESDPMSVAAKLVRSDVKHHGDETLIVGGPS
jgi:hypothetical protein